MAKEKASLTPQSPAEFFQKDWRTSVAGRLGATSVQGWVEGNGVVDDEYGEKELKEKERKPPQAKACNPAINH